MIYIFKHWKTSVVAILVGVLTVMVYTGKITMTEWAVGLGSIGTVIGFLSKDWDKTDQ